MTARICAECGVEFEANGSRGKPRMFCTETHKQVHANRRASRGKSLMVVAQAWRKARGSGEAGKFFFQELCEMLDNFNAQDLAAKRMDPVDYAKALCGFHPVNPDYHGGRTFEADRWLDRLDANR
jgi:hypothetical protein